LGKKIQVHVVSGYKKVRTEFHSPFAHPSSFIHPCKISFTRLRRTALEFYIGLQWETSFD